MIGGLYASGYDAHELDSITRNTDWEALLGIGDEARRSELFIDQKVENDRSLLTLRLDGFSPVLPEAISTGARMTQFIEGLVWGSAYHSEGSFDNLKYRFRAMATDLVAGRSIVLDSGNLALALRASATVPLRFSPVARDSMLLVDGGLLSNVPVHVARELGCDIVIVVNTTSPLQSVEKLQDPWNVADQVVTLMMQQLSRSELDDADFVITPDLHRIVGTDFSNPAEIIDSGEVAARRVAGRLRELLARSRQEKRWRQERGQVFHNLGIDCPDRRLLASLGLEGDPSTIALEELQGKLDALGSSGEYRDLSARISYQGDSAHFTLAGTPAPTVESIAYHGVDRLPLREISGSVEGIVGRPLNFDSIAIVSEKVVSAMRHDGYSFFRFDSVRYDENARRVDLYVDEGIIRSIRYEGLVDCAEFVVSRELEFRTGDLFRAEMAGTAVNRILRAGFFRQAAIEPHWRKDGGLEVVVKVKERSTALLRFSANVNSERYTRLGVELAQENLFGQGTRIAARFAGGLRDRMASLDLRSNRIYGTYWTFAASGYGSLRNVNVYSRTLDPAAGEIERLGLGEYRELRVGGKARFGRQVERLGLLSIEGRYERQGTENLSVAATDQRWHTVTSLKFGTRFDTQDRVPFARDGSVIDMSYETAQHLLGADESFSKIDMQAEFFASLGRRHVIHPQFHIGFADATLPLVEQFSLGGQSSMFGLREDESRGRQLLLASLEYRYLMPFKIYFDTYLSLRYDLGATWLKPAEIKLNELEHGVGFSIGLDTPLGPADFSLGRSFNFNKPNAPHLMNFGPVIAYFSFGYQMD
jgi:NTE family protein